MNLKQNVMALIVAAIGITVCGTARADVTMSLDISIDNSQFQNAEANLSDAQQSELNDDLTSKLYLSGKRERLDTSSVSYIIDIGKGTMILINNEQDTYTVMPVNHAILRHMMSVELAGAGEVGYHVVDTGKSTMYDRHRCHHYIVTTLYRANVGTDTFRTNILAAEDLPGVDPALAMIVATETGAVGGQIRGIPILSKTTVTSQDNNVGTIAITIEATDVSTDPISADTFQIPDGDTKVTKKQFMATLPNDSL